MKINTFLISKAKSEVFNWALGLYTLATGMTVVDGWISDPNDPAQGVIGSLQTLQALSPVQVAEGAIGVGAALTMWGVLQSCFARTKRAFHFTFLGLMMVFSLLTFICTTLFTYSTDTAIRTFASHFVNYSYSAIAINTVLLGAFIVGGCVGKLRAYGASLIITPIFMGGITLLNYYLYNVAGGLTLPEIATYVNMGSIVGLVLTVLPMGLLRWALETEEN